MRIKKLVNRATAWLEENQYTESTIRISYVLYWKGFTATVSEDENFTEKIVADYLIKKYGRNIVNDNSSNLTPKEYRIYRAFNSLLEFNENGSISGTSMKGAEVRQPLPEFENKVLESYMEHLKDLGYSENSKRLNHCTVHQYLRACPLFTLDNDKLLEYLAKFSSYAKSTAKGKLKILRQFHRYCYNAKFLDTDFSEIFPSSKNGKNLEIPSVYTPDEIHVLLEYLRNNFENRKRNYAIALLAAVYGFRAGDIATMEMNSIDWENSTIHIVQAKTGNPVKHRLIPQVGNALASYLLEDRPKSDLSFVFLKDNGEALNTVTLSSAIFNGFLRCGIPLNGRKHGLHSLRHSLATNMLSTNSGIMEISKTLGHSSVDSTKIYAKVNLSQLRLCMLEVPNHE